MTIDPRRDIRREAGGASVRPDAEAASTALAAAVSGLEFRTRVKLKADVGHKRVPEAGPAPEPDPPGREPDRVEAIPPRAEAVADLTLIRGLTLDQARRLEAAGITAFAHIAAWRRDDVLGARRLLGLKREISKQNWIEQAAVLALPGPVRAPRRDTWLVETAAAKPARPAAPEQVAGPPPAAVLASKPPKPSPSAFDRLDLIFGMSPAAEAMLRAGGVLSVADIACWTAADVSFWRQRLGAGKRLTREGWIEQAEMLRQGRVTAHAHASEHLPDVELISPTPPVGVDPSAEPSLLTQLRTARLDLTRDSAAEVVTAPDASPPPLAAPDRMPEPPHTIDVPVRTAAATPRRLLPRYVEFVRHSFFELPPLPLSPLIGDGPATAGDSVERRTSPVPVAERPTSTGESDPIDHLVDAEPSSEAQMRRHALPPASPARARRPRSSNLVPRRPRMETPRDVLEPAKRLTERLAELDQKRDPPLLEGVPPLSSLVRKRPISAADPEPFTTADHGGRDVMEEAEVVITPQSSAFPSAPHHSIQRDATKAPPLERGVREKEVRANPANHSAYREAVEEASVEIVRRTPAGEDR